MNDNPCFTLNKNRTLNLPQILPFCVIHLFDKSKSGPGMRFGGGMPPQAYNPSVISLSASPMTALGAVSRVNRFVQYLPSAPVSSKPPPYPVNTATAQANNQSFAAQFQQFQRNLYSAPAAKVSFNY